MAFAEMAEIYVTGTEFFGGASGLFLPKDTGNFLAFQFGGGRGAFWVMLVVTALCLLVNLAILCSPLGYYLRSIRDNENAAQAIGVGLLRNKVLAMMISAVLTALIGAIYARYLAFVDPYLLVSPVLTVEIILFATVGGLGSVVGPALAPSCSRRSAKSCAAISAARCRDSIISFMARSSSPSSSSARPASGRSSRRG